MSTPKSRSLQRRCTHTRAIVPQWFRCTHTHTFLLAGISAYAAKVAEPQRSSGTCATASHMHVVALRWPLSASTVSALVCGPMVACVHCGVSGFVERENFKTDDEFHLLAYHYVAYEVRGVRFGRCDAAGTATTWGCRSRVVSTQIKISPREPCFFVLFCCVDVWNRMISHLCVCGGAVAYV